MATLTRRGIFRAHYDPRGDTLYISSGDPRPSESESRERGILLRYAFEDDAPSGVTVIGYRKNRWEQEPSRLARLIVQHVGGDLADATTAIVDAVKGNA